MSETQRESLFSRPEYETAVLAQFSLGKNANEAYRTRSDIDLETMRRFEAEVKGNLKAWKNKAFAEYYGISQEDAKKIRTTFGIKERK